MTTTLSITYCAELLGLQAHRVRVEAHLSGGLPQFSIVGLTGSAARESRERVRAAIETAGFRFPQGRLTVNLAPAELPKSSGHYDLAIALAILSASGEINAQALANVLCFGELSLTAALLPMPRAIAFATSIIDRGFTGLEAEALKGTEGQRLVFPLANQKELQTVQDQDRLVCASGLLQLVDDLLGRRPLPAVPPLTLPSRRSEDGSCKLSEYRRAAAGAWEAIQGQSNAKGAAVIAATGLHNLLLMGSPGVGKSMIANSLNGLMPELAAIQAREVQSIHVLSGVSSHSSTMVIDHESTHGQDLSCLPPFRAPHHTASALAVVGGGYPVIPGEVSLAHRGVLFLDELAEFGRSSLEALREPLETGEVHIVRMRTRLSLPARVLLVAAMNPCPCGYYGASFGPKQCHCSSEQVQRYRMRLSGPLLDRFDLALLMKRELPSQPMQDTDSKPAPESYTETRQRIKRSRQKANDRQGCANGLLKPEQLHELAKAMSGRARELLRKFMDVSGNSLRVHDRLLRVALTVADLDDAPRVEPAHMAKAIEMRRGLDRPDAIKALV